MLGEREHFEVVGAERGLQDHRVDVAMARGEGEPGAPTSRRHVRRLERIRVEVGIEPEHPQPVGGVACDQFEVSARAVHTLRKARRARCGAARTDEKRLT